MTGQPQRAGLTVPDLVVEAFSRYGDREAFVLGDQRMTYAHAAARTSQLAHVLAASGVGPGVGVGALSPNTPEVFLLQMATYLLGGRYTGLHPLASAGDHSFICDDAEISLLVVHPKFDERAADIAARTPGIRRVLTLGAGEVGEDLLALSDVAPVARLVPGPAQPDDLAWLTYTGGTTGRSKGVMVPHRALVRMAELLPVGWCLPPAPRYLVSSPITHAGGLPILSTLLQGGTVVLQSGFDPQEWADAVARERINFVFAVPTMLYALLDSGVARAADLSSLRTLLYGAAPMTPSRIVEALDTFGPVLVQGYGQTESLGVGTSLRADEHDASGRPELLTSCGRAVPGVRAAVLDESDAETKPGDVGELCLRSGVVMDGYWKQPDQTAEALRGGWLRTGDLAVRDDTGYLHIVDRRKDLIITGGFNVYPKEIEDVIAAAPEISAVAVVGLPDDRWGEAVTAFVTLRPGQQLDADALIARVRERKGSHQAPKAIHVVPQLPKTAAGKIDKKALRGAPVADEQSLGIRRY
jgi:fatty-acyl-CoA synthase